MATQTPNLGLTLPVGTENVSRTVINGNNTLIDTFAGNVNTAMDQMGSNLGILETGDTATHAIAKGEYVTWKGASYTADAAISIGETLAATGGSKNLTACDKGIANALNSKIVIEKKTVTIDSGSDLILTSVDSDKIPIAIYAKNKNGLYPLGQLMIYGNNYIADFYDYSRTLPYPKYANKTLDIIVVYIQF